MIATVAIASLGLGVVAAQLIGGAREVAPMAAGSSEPSVAPTATAEAAATATESPTPAPSPTAAAVGTLANAAIANVSVDALHLREAADASSPSLATLGAGTELFVIGQPEEDEDHLWYRVAVGSFTDQLCTDCVDAIGWVATPRSDEERWIEEAETSCPTAPVTVDQLTDMTSLMRLHCFGGAEFTGTGWADNHCCGYVGGFVFEPEWLAWPPWRFFRAADFYTTLDYSMMPGPGEDWALVMPEPGDIIEFTAHFDDPAAPECLAQSSDGADATDLVMPDRGELVLTCRLRLVITDYEVIGHEGEGSCGCLTPPSPSPGTGSERRLSHA